MSTAHQISDQIIYGKLASVSRFAGERLRRVSRSALIAESGAYAAGLVTGSGSLVHQIQSEIEHLYALRSVSRHLLDYFAYDLEEGDILISADVYKGGTKGQTLTMLLPVFADGELIVSPVIRAQMADLGGEIPGGFNPDAFEVWQESMRLTPVKLYKGGKLQRDVRRFVLANSRSPELLESDLLAMQACLEEARRSIQAVVGSYGLPAVHQAIERMNERTRLRTVELLPAVTSPLSGAAKLAITQADVSIQLQMERRDRSWKFDFTGTSEQVSLPYNISQETAAACAVTALLSGSLEDLEINDGLLDVFEFVLPEGSLVHAAFPAATAFGFLTSGQAAAAAVTQAMRTEFDPEFPAVHGPAPLTILYPPVGSQTPVEPVFLEPGFAMAENGWSAPVLQGARRLVSAEELEWRSGLRIGYRKLLEDGDMEVRLDVLSGKYEVSIFVPEGGTDVRVVAGDGVRSGTAKGIPVAAGDALKYRYASAEPLKRLAKEDDDGPSR
ncbi:hydantoinase B/oxoprolinase family protein [Paenibacillus sp. TH7-28]